MLGVAVRVPGVVPVAAFSPARAGTAMAGLVSGGMRCLAQRGDDLGARMGNLIADLLAAGHPAALVTGSDLPTLPIEHLAEAARVLSGGGADVVLGPAEDGGYYLVGLRRPAPELFVDVAWGTAAVLEVTLARARALGLRAHLLPEWHDVDTVERCRAPSARSRRRRPWRRDGGVADAALAGRVSPLTLTLSPQGRGDRA